MHCPRCGQQQVSEDIKFCSRCGFPLGLVSEVLAHGGMLPQLNDSEKNEKWLTRKFGLKIALLWFSVFILLIPLAAITRAPGNITGGLAVFATIGALFITVLSFLFLSGEKKSFERKNDPADRMNAPQNLSGKRAPTALPPTTSEPVSNFVPPSAGSWSAPETGELIPHSVTEGTTKLLQKDEQI